MVSIFWWKYSRFGLSGETVINLYFHLLFVKIVNKDSLWLNRMADCYVFKGNVL